MAPRIYDDPVEYRCVRFYLTAGPDDAPLEHRLLHHAGALPQYAVLHHRILLDDAIVAENRVLQYLGILLDRKSTRLNSSHRV